MRVVGYKTGIANDDQHSIQLLSFKIFLIIAPKKQFVKP